MRITKESQLDGGAALAIRHRLGLSQKAFWNAICVVGPTGSSYETNKWNMPPPVRRLLFLHYVVGFPTNETDLAKLKAAAAPANRVVETRSAAADIAKAVELLSQAQVKINATK